MSDTVTLRLRVSPDDVKAMEERIKRAGGKPIDVPVRAPGLPEVERQAKFAEGSVGSLKAKIRELNAEIEHLADNDAIAKKQDEIRGLEGRVSSLLSKSAASGAASTAAGAAGAAGGIGGLLNGGLAGGALLKLGGIGAAVGGVAALTAALKDGAAKAIELDTEVRNIGSLGVANFERFREISREMSTRLPQTAAEIAKGTYQAISAGVDPMKAGAFVETAAQAGIAGLSSTETAVNALSSVVNAYRLNADQARLVSDQMFTAVKNGKTTFEEINAAIANVVPVAASAGVGFDQVSAGIATMTKQGIPTAQASTQMRQAIVELLKPGKELEEIMTKAGIANGAAALKTLGLQGTLQKLQVAADASGKTMTQVFSSVEAGSAALALTGENAAMAAADLDAMNNAAGAMGKAYEVNARSAANQLKLLNNNVDAVKMAVVETFGPAANWVLENFTGGLQKINEALLSTEALMRRTEQRGAEAFADQAQRQRLQDRAQAVKMLGLENDAALDNVKITADMVRGLEAAKGATDEQIKSTVEYWKALQNVAAAPPPATDTTSAGAGKKSSGVNEALQLALENLRREEELALLRAKYAKAGEEDILATRVQYLQLQLGEQIKHKDKALSIAKTRSDIEKAQLEIGLIAMNRAVAGSIEDLEKRLRDVGARLSKVDPRSPHFAAAVLETRQLSEQLDELRKKASDPLYQMLPGFGGLIDVDEKGFRERIAEGLKLDEKQKEETLNEYRALGGSLGQSVGSALGDALKGAKSPGDALRAIYRSILAEMLEFIIRKAVITQVAVALEELATKGLAGLITAGIAMGVIQGGLQAAKGAISGYEHGGVIVGESGPEIIAPARDFSSFADRIVETAVQTFTRALMVLEEADRRQRQDTISVGVRAEPVEFVQRGSDLHAVVLLQEFRQSRSTLGGP